MSLCDHWSNILLPLQSQHPSTLLPLYTCTCLQKSYRYVGFEVLTCCHLLGHGALQSVCEQAFRRSVSPPFSGSKISWACPLARAQFMLFGSFFIFSAAHVTSLIQIASPAYSSVAGTVFAVLCARPNSGICPNSAWCHVAFALRSSKFRARSSVHTASCQWCMKWDHHVWSQHQEELDHKSSPPPAPR
jgi:hypothetical protein